MIQVDLGKFSVGKYRPASKLKIIIWYGMNILLFKTMLPIPSKIKISVLRLFGAKVGCGIIIKPNVNIKYPWLLTIGDYCWIGEGVWIDNLGVVTMGSNVCLSQGCYLLTGSHDYKKESFDLIVGSIYLESGVWIGAKAIVCPNVICKTHSILTAGSVVTKTMNEYSVYQGNPAEFKRNRI